MAASFDVFGLACANDVDAIRRTVQVGRSGIPELSAAPIATEPRHRKRGDGEGCEERKTCPETHGYSSAAWSLARS